MKPWHKTGAPRPDPGSWTFPDIPAPLKRPGHADYHAPDSPGVSSSRLKIFAYGIDGEKPGPDGGAVEFYDLFVGRTRQPKSPTEAMLIGTLVDRLRSAWCGGVPALPSAARCGVIPADLSGEGGRLQGEIAAGLLAWAIDAAVARHAETGEHDPGDPLALPPGAQLLGYAPFSGRGKTAADRLAREDGLIPTTTGEWAAGLELAQRIWHEDPGEWSASRPLIVKAGLWDTAREAFRAVAEPRTLRAEDARRLVLEGEGFAEYYVEATRRIEIREEDLRCPECGMQLEWSWGEDALPVGLHCEGDFCHNWFPDVELANPDGVDNNAVVNITLRAMLDRLIVTAGLPLLVEVKTARHPEPSAGRRWRGFDADTRKFRHLEQVAFYRMVLREAWGLDWNPPVRIVAIGNAYPHAVDWRPFDPEALDRAEATVEAQLHAYALRVAGLLPWSAAWAASRESEPITD